MLICFPTTTADGLAAELSPHFGSAPYFTLVDSDGESAETLPNDHAAHQHGSCRPAHGLIGRHVGAVVCRGLGRRALAHLAADAVPVLMTAAATVRTALDEYRAGTLRPWRDDETCPGHGEAAHHSGH